MAVALLFSACATDQAARREGAQPAGDPLEGATGEQLFTAGSALVRRGDLVRGEQYLAAAMDRGYPAARALPLLLRVCIAGSRLGSAMQYASPHLSAHPEDFKLRYLVASIHLGLGQPDDARAELVRVVREQPKYAPARYLLGTLLRDRFADPQGAAEHFTAHQQLDPDSRHASEITAWLRERELATAAKAGKRAPRSDAR